MKTPVYRVLGIVGAILPLLPTTPFLLLAASAECRGYAGCRVRKTDTARFDASGSKPSGTRSTVRKAAVG